MIVTRVREPSVVEACPQVVEDGFHEPTDAQFRALFSQERTGKLNPSLMDGSLVTWGDATATLAVAALFRALEVDAATARPGFGGAGDPVVSMALADLAVTGSSNYRSLRRAIGEGAEADVPAFRVAVREALGDASSRVGITPREGAGEALRGCVDHVVDRALEVAWAIDGPVDYRARRRPALGWLCVNAELDPPHRPVNVPCAPWSMGDVDVNMTHAGRGVRCRIRYAVAGAVDRYDDFRVLESLPPPQLPVLPATGMVVIFLHGHSSRLEEACTLYPALVSEHTGHCVRDPLTLIAFDFPTNGYSEYIDHEDIAPLESTTHFSPDHPSERRFGLLEYYERVVVGFVDALERRQALAGVPSIRHRIAAVIGGSMGGNLALRLSERLVTDPDWLPSLVAWSPASVDGSFGRYDYVVPSPGEEVDPFGKEALERPHARCQQPEEDGSRAEFIALQMQGERLISDGTSEFQIGVRALPFLLAPLINGLAPLLGPVAPIFSGLTGPMVIGSAVVEGVSNVITIKQSDEWVRAECREGYDAEAAARVALLSLQETYNGMRRRMHWRIAYEQLLFSHQDEVAASRGVTCFQASEIPTLLIAGGDDITDASRFNIFGSVMHMAPTMTANDGKTILIDHTGHSIHAERPRWLAQQIYEFVCRQRPSRVISVVRRDGAIAALGFGHMWAPLPVRAAIREIERERAQFFVVDRHGNRAMVIPRRHLTTAPDERIDNNLRELPESSLPQQDDPDRGPVEGFDVTHIRIVHGREGQPWTSWVTHLCNDAQGYQIETRRAENRTEFGAVYRVHVGDDTRELRLVEFLTTTPDDSTENNLSSLPDLLV
ncbi:MAG: alpha/beta fold hydrolase [Myxococcales bacterium]|jgi:pimeloyl-ACP methyl ester carboxylesterase